MLSPKKIEVIFHKIQVQFFVFYEWDISVGHFPWPPMDNFSLCVFVHAAQTNECWLKRASQGNGHVLYNADSASFEHLVKLSQALWSHFTRNHEFYGLLYVLSVCAKCWKKKLRKKSVILVLLLFDSVKDGHTKSWEVFIVEKKHFLNLAQRANVGNFRFLAHFIPIFAF